MPGLDRTGPKGQGARTGKGMGKCNANKKNLNNAAQEDSPGGRGLGRGRGFRRGKC